MAVTVRLPGILRQLANGERAVAVSSSSVGETITQVCTQYPAIGERLLDDGGQPHRFVNVFVNGEDVRLLGGVDTPVGDGDEVIIVPAVAGG